MEITFQPWPKTPRLNRNIIVTEKIDGTNGCIVITEDGQVGAQSHNQVITPDNDNYGFARWVYENADDLREYLGAGYHYGEWWGAGINRGYGLHTTRRFSLFNTHRWDRMDVSLTVDGLDVVPVLYHGPFSEEAIQKQLSWLRDFGSNAAPFYNNPEGVCIYHTASKQVYKVLLENDDLSKSEVSASAATLPSDDIPKGLVA